MVKMGFKEDWCRLVMDYIVSLTFYVILNGKVVGNIVPSLGICQECPLSPYLFLFCVEAFSSLISKAEYDGELMGYRCFSSRP